LALLGHCGKSCLATTFDPAVEHAIVLGVSIKGSNRVKTLLSRLIHDDNGQDIAEYAIMLAVILIIVVGTVKLIGTNANNTFSSVASSLQ
jgi:Flp pilus assembly pilin Flp